MRLFQLKVGAQHASISCVIEVIFYVQKSLLIYLHFSGGADIANYVMKNRLERSASKIMKRTSAVPNQNVIDPEHNNLIHHEQSTNHKMSFWVHYITMHILNFKGGQNVIDYVMDSGGKTLDLKEKESWQKRMLFIDDCWNEQRAILFNNYLINNAFMPGKCQECRNDIASNYIRCLKCVKRLCGTCDRKKHYDQPFHLRMLDTKDQRTPLVSMEFVSYPNGDIYKEGYQIKNSIKV